MSFCVCNLLLPPTRLWETLGYSLTPSLSPLLISKVSNSSLSVHAATARALGVWLESHVSEASSVMDELFRVYSEKRTPPPPKTDSFGRVVITEYRWAYVASWLLQLQLF